MEIQFTKLGADDRSQYSLNVKKSLVFSLLFFNLLIFFFPRIDISPDEPKGVGIVINVENIPSTRQMRRNPPPPKPTIPVPSDDESIPEDETIEETTLKLTNIFDDTEGMPGLTGTVISPPKPIAWVFPEYPDSERKKGVQGEVKLSIHINSKGRVIEVIVLDNSTGSAKCAQAAKEAAFGSRFYPAKEGAKPVDYWITQPYRFDLKK